jgi:hypothetical protein
MIRTNTWFKFTPPPDWGESNENGRLTYRSPKGEVLIVSTAAVTGPRSGTGAQDIVTKTFQNAVDSVREAAAQSDLRITRPLSVDNRVSIVECWTIEAETLDGRQVFFQSVCRNGMGVLLVTFEGYHSSEAKAEYERFLRSIEKNN